MGEKLSWNEGGWNAGGTFINIHCTHFSHFKHFMQNFLSIFKY